MEYASTYSDTAYATVPAQPRGIKRSPFTPLPFLLPVLLCGVSYALGGAPLLTDLGFESLTVICGLFLVNELIRFPIRFGLGGLLVFGGVLIWLCHDYLSVWNGYNFQSGVYAFQAWVVAKAAFWDSVFALAMTVGLIIPWGRWMEKLILFPPEPKSPNTYWYLVLAMFLFGILPYFIFTQEFGLISMARAAIGSYLPGGTGVLWDGGRTGNINFSAYAYLAQWLQVGEVSGTLAAAYFVFMAPSLGRKIVCAAIWFFYVACAFETTRRGVVLYNFMPVIAFYFIKYQVRARELARRLSLRAYLIAGILLLVYLCMCQVLGTYRSRGLGSVSISDWFSVDLLKSQGDTMFSEGLNGFQQIGEGTPAFYNRWPGEAIVRPYLDAVSSFFIECIPRALWTSKPIDPVWAWYNRVSAGRSTDETGTIGTTISEGPAGHWYFRYGPAGVLEGGLLVGWLMGVTERAFRHTNGSLISLLMSLGVAIWLFRTYRDFIYQDLYGLLIGAVVFTVFVWISNVFTSPAPQMQTA